MKNRLVPPTVLLVLAIFVWLAHKPSIVPGTNPANAANEARVQRDGSFRPRQGDPTRSDSAGPDSTNQDQADSDTRTEGRRRNRPTSAAPGTFDFYLLNLSWSPEFCTTHPSASECGTHVGFILHGLWPQNTDGTYPEHCSDDPPPANLSSFTDLTPDPGLLRHEWSTHGTCSGLSGDAFFTLARRAFHSITIPRDLATLKSETSQTPTEVLADFARANPTFPPASIALSCGNNRLTAIEACLDKTLKPIPCGALRSCRANSIRITPP